MQAGVLQQIGATYHLVDTLQFIIDHHRQMVGKDVVYGA